MYLGHLVELVLLRPTVFFAQAPLATVALLSAIPIPDPDMRKAEDLVEGDVSEPA